jgi:hypothetical protein
MGGVSREAFMNRERALAVITAVNLVLVCLSLARTGPALADNAPPVLRGRGLEIVDDQGRVRAAIQLLPAKGSGADAQRETVILRLITEKGRPSVKIAASEESAGLSFAGPTGTKDTYVILEAKDKATSLRLRNEDGREQVIKP